MNNFYKLQFTSDVDNLLERAQQYFALAEVSKYNKQKKQIELLLISSAGEQEVHEMCDEFKKEIELNNDARLVYKVLSIEL